MRPAINLFDPESSRLLLGYVAGALAAAFFATKAIVIKLAIPLGVDAATALTWRMIIAVPFFAIVGFLGYRERRRKSADYKPSRRDIAATCLVGIVGYYVASYFDFAGLQYVSAQLDRLILMTYPFFVVLIGAIAFGRRVTIAMIGALSIAYLGLTLIFAHDLQVEGEQTWIGGLLVFGAAICFAVHQVYAKPLIDRIGARLFTSIAMSAAGVAVIGHFFVIHPVEKLFLPDDAMWLMLALGTVSTVFPAYLTSASIGLVGPQPTAMMANVSPVVTIIMAVLVLGEIFSIWHAFGVALVFLGIFMFTRADARAAIRPHKMEVQ